MPVPIREIEQSEKRAAGQNGPKRAGLTTALGGTTSEEAPAERLERGPRTVGMPVPIREIEQSKKRAAGQNGPKRAGLTTALGGTT